MDANSFTILLEDLYDRYNPSKKGEIPNIVEKYNGQELTAISTFSWKYNFPKHANYDIDLNNPLYLNTLISRYSKGERMLLDKKKISEKDVISQKVDEANQQLKSVADQTANAVEEKIKALDMFIKSKRDEINAILQGFVPVSKDENIETKINILFTEAQFQLPENVSQLSVGTRLIVKDILGIPYGLEVKDVVCDYISVPGKCIREITIDRV